MMVAIRRLLLKIYLKDLESSGQIGIIHIKGKSYEKSSNSYPFHNWLGNR